jgi:hypothetical protein
MTAAVTTSAVTSTSAATSVSLPVPKREEYSIVDIALTFIKEKPRDIVKALGYSTFWAGQVNPNLHPNVQNFSMSMGDVKNLLGAIEVPDKVNTLWGSFCGLCSDFTNQISGSATATWEKVGDACRKTFKDATGLTNGICDSIDFSTKYIQYDPEMLRWVKGIGFAATLGGSGVGAAEQMNNLSKSWGDVKKSTLYVINLARDVSYVALGILGLSFILTATPMVTWMILACLTSGLTFTIGGYFYEKIVDPENKGKNLNPAAVVDNVVAQRAARV